ncbi:hypothetical protein GOODEAATRI_020955 [Goodea atripinnis]|uniref:Uncharacterized protein n=1 Tax=Goodea atripinnis TaxID=208336 RepID=A0ABV0N428_9TELE
MRSEPRFIVIVCAKGLGLHTRPHRKPMYDVTTCCWFKSVAEVSKTIKSVQSKLACNIWFESSVHFSTVRTTGLEVFNFCLYIGMRWTRGWAEGPKAAPATE